MRNKQDILLSVQSTEASALKGILEVLIDLRDLLVTMEGSTEHYRGVDIKYREMELNKPNYDPIPGSRS